jgi:putative cell wall-binding protein
MRYRTTFRGGVAATAALIALALLPALPAGASGPTPSAGDGLLSGSIVGATGQHDYNLLFVPITGSGATFDYDVTTDGSNEFELYVPGGYYHVLVTSENGTSAARWYNGSTNHEIIADRLLVITEEVSNFNVTLDATPSKIIGTWSNATYPTHDVLVQAFNYQLDHPADRIPLATDIVKAGQTYSLEGLPAGGFRVVFQDLTSSVSGVQTEFLTTIIADGTTADLGTNALNSGGTVVERIAGADRYSTAVELAQERFPAQPDTVFIVNGLNFPDALSAGPAAYIEDAPVLLVSPTSIPTVVADALEAMDPDTIFVIGGTGSVSAAVKAQLDGYATTVTRIAGVDRYATSLAVAEEFFGNDADRVYLANGAGFPDALGAGPAAVNNGGLLLVEGGPVLLVNGASATGLDAATTAYLDTLAIDTPVYIAGGLGSVKKAIDDDLFGSPLNLHYHYRLAGDDRYETAAMIVDRAFGHSNTVYLATGANFPDALAGGAAAGLDSAPILLVTSTCIPTPAYEQLERLQPSKVILLGGTAVLSNSLLSLPEC